MKKIIILTLSLFMLTSKVSNAQFSISTSVGVSNFDLILFSTGGDLAVKYQFKNKLRLGMSTGYYFHSYDYLTGDFFSEEFRSKILPSDFSIEYVFGNKRFKPVLGMEVGMNRIKVDNYSVNFFSIGPAIGFDSDIGEKLTFNSVLRVKNIYNREYPSITESEIGIKHPLYISFNLGLSYRFIQN